MITEEIQNRRTIEPNQEKSSLAQRLLWWTLFAAAFGYVEAVVVAYLWHMIGMKPGLNYEIFFTARGLPMDSAHILAAVKRQGLIHIECSREIATLLLLFGAAWTAGRDRRERWALFAYAFAVWDLTYYLFIACWLRFPHSLMDKDIYYLVPIAWYGPVWFPVLVCMPALIALSLWLLRTAPKPLKLAAEERGWHG